MKRRSVFSFLRSAHQGRGVERAVRRHRAHYRAHRGGEGCGERADAGEVARNYYDLATDAYEWGWGESFHFGVRRRGESLEASLVRHELRLAERMGLRAGMTALDLGCGIGGPMRNIARATGARIVGVNICGYQVRRAVELNRAAGLDGQLGVIECDWMQLPLGAATLDAAYTIEASCHASDRGALFGEVRRVLKAGAPFVGYEWVLTPAYDPSDPRHRRYRAGIEEGSGVPPLATQADIEGAITDSGLELLECRDLAPECDPATPWYLPLEGEGLSLAAFRRSHLGGLFLQGAVGALELTRVLPRGAGAVIRLLRLAGDPIARAGRAGIFTPMLFFHARKGAR